MDGYRRKYSPSIIHQFLRRRRRFDGPKFRKLFHDRNPGAKLDDILPLSQLFSKTRGTPVVPDSFLTYTTKEPPGTV